MRKLVVFAGIVVVALIAFNLFTFTVDETKKAAVLRFGEIIRVVEQPGLQLKIPFINRVVYLDDRVLSYDIQPRDILTSDQKRLTIDNYAIWRVGEPRLFIEANGGRISTAQSRIDDIVYSDLRDVLAKHSLNDIVSEKRLAYLQEVTVISSAKLIKFGIKLIDVRIKRADLPTEIEQAVFARMRSERERIAAQLRAEGEEEAKRITSQADKERAIILADARKAAEQEMGIGDARALEIYANAYNQDADFYQFWRTLESYETALKGNTSIVLSTESDYLRFLDNLAEEKKEE
jgi:membrane protease subunit HflC